MATKANRRDPRVAVALPVRLQTAAGVESYETKDISVRGVFIVCEDPLPLRRLARFRTVIDDGEELQMLGLVAHRINVTDAAERGIAPGMGLQLYSVGEGTKIEWNDYIGRCIESAGIDSDDEGFRHLQLHLADHKLLERFVENDLPAGEIFYRTPDPLDEGTQVVIDLVHPMTARGFHIPGTVEEAVVDGGRRSRGMRIVFEEFDDETSSEFQAFVQGEISEVFE